MERAQLVGSCSLMRSFQSYQKILFLGWEYCITVLTKVSPLSLSSSLCPPSFSLSHIAVCVKKVTWSLLISWHDNQYI